MCLAVLFKSDSTILPLPGELGNVSWTPEIKHGIHLRPKCVHVLRRKDLNQLKRSSWTYLTSQFHIFHPRFRRWLHVSSQCGTMERGILKPSCYKIENWIIFVSCNNFLMISNWMCTDQGLYPSPSLHHKLWLALYNSVLCWWLTELCAYHKNPKARVINLEFGNKLQENIKPK